MPAFLDRQEVHRILPGFNPWWSGKKAEVPPFRRLAFALCKQYLQQARLRRAILLSGPRRVGKTTILLQLAQELARGDADPTGIFYVSLDHPLLKLLPFGDILRIYHEEVYPEGKPVLLLMDEIQYSKDWELYVKDLVDHQPQYRIIATGSASVVHRQQLAESGVGRWVLVPVPTLSFFEYLHIRREELPKVAKELSPRQLLGKPKRELNALAAKLRPFQPLFLRYLLVGGFPETAQQLPLAACQRLLREDVVERVLKRDMTALFNIRNVNDLERLFIYICLHTGGIFETQTIAAALQSNRVTIANYLELLEQANLIYRLPPAEVGGKKLLKGRHKVYLVDAALRNAVLLRGEEILTQPDELGVVVETTVLRHLAAFYYRDTPRICYWRDTKSAKEVDVVLQTPKYTLPVEVKFREHADIAGSGLKAFCQLEKVPVAYFVTKRDDDFATETFEGTSILKVPAHVFCYLLGQAERVPWKE